MKGKLWLPWKDPLVPSTLAALYAELPWVLTFPKANLLVDAFKISLPDSLLPTPQRICNLGVHPTWQENRKMKKKKDENACLKLPKCEFRPRGAPRVLEVTSGRLGPSSVPQGLVSPPPGARILFYFILLFYLLNFILFYILVYFILLL